MASERFSMEAMVRGCHVLMEVWEAAVRKPENRQDTFAVACSS